MSILLWVLGLSLDNVSTFLGVLGCRIAKSTAWENLQAAGEKAQRLWKGRLAGKVRVRAIGTISRSTRSIGKEVTMGMVTDGFHL